MLFDTTILIDYLRGRDEARDLFEAQSERPSISVASILELYAGVSSRREEVRIEQLLSQVTPLPVTADISKRAGVFVRLYQASHSVAAMDAIIAATAEHHGLRLCTHNVKHFPMVLNLKRAY